MTLGCSGPSSSESTGQDGGDGADGSTSGVTSTGAPTGGSGESEDGVDGDSSGAAEAFSMVRIEPQNVTIEVELGAAPPPVAFTAYGVTDEGDDIPLAGGTWSFDEPALAEVDPASGQLRVSGVLGGAGELRFMHEGLESATTVAVRVSYEHNPQNLDGSVFEGANSPDADMVLVYPYDGTVFPLGLAGPEVQWDGTGAGDLYKVTMESEFFSFVGFSSTPPPSRYTLPASPVGDGSIWDPLTRSSAPGGMTLAVQRFDGSTAYLPVERRLEIADARLSALVYYAEAALGDVKRIRTDRVGVAETFLELPPASAAAPGGTENRCIGCHSISADGSTIVASTYGSAAPWATWNTRDGTMIFASGEGLGGQYYPGAPSGFQAISPDGSYVLQGQARGPNYGSNPSAEPGVLELSTNDSVEVLATLAVSEGSPVHPAWSLDGTKIAFGVRSDGNWLDFTTSSLWVAEVDLVTPQFGPASQLVGPSVPDRMTVTHPTFSPDSEWIAFNMATQSNGRDGAGELWLVSVDGTTVVELARANGAEDLDAGQRATSFEPAFLPVTVGGYNWLVFSSERAYGNVLPGRDPANRSKQLWIAAIDAEPGNADPSHPAFWLAGQDTEEQNFQPKWSLPPCREVPESCSAGFECCSGHCGDDGLCAAETPACAPEGDACSTQNDCCEPGLGCIHGFCS